MNKKQILTLIFICSWIVSASGMAKGPCPETSGERSACEVETELVRNARGGLVVNESFKYCKEGTTSSEEISCRQLVNFKSQLTGNISQSYFEDWLIINLPETTDAPKKLLTIRFIFIQKPNGLFDIYIDDDPKMTLNVDKVLMDEDGDRIQKDVEVFFDSDNLPSFILPGLNVSTGEIVNLSISYSRSEALVDFLGSGRLDIFSILEK